MTPDGRRALLLGLGALARELAVRPWADADEGGAVKRSEWFDAMRCSTSLPGGHCPTTLTQDTKLLVVGDQDFHKFTDGISSSKMKKA
jgi:hypothetical protein